MLQFLLMVISFKVFFVECKTGDSESLTALSFINIVRSCAVHSEFLGIKLPELLSYATSSTSNLIVNQIIEKEYIGFWQDLRKWDYEQDKNRLCVLSKGAFLASLVSPTSIMASSVIFDPLSCSLPGTDESALLVPVLKGDLPRYRLRCKTAKDENLLESLNGMIVASKDYVGLERELVLSAVRMLDIATQLSKCSWTYVSEDEKGAFRSGDRAFECIRDWERHSTGLKILYFKFILHARQLIAHLTNNVEETKIVAALHRDLEGIIQTELPFKLMREVGREENANHILRFSNDGLVYQETVDAFHLLFVKDSRKIIRRGTMTYKTNSGNYVNLFHENGIMYVSVGESYGNSFTGGWEGLLKKIIRTISEKDFIIDVNPKNFLLK